MHAQVHLGISHHSIFEVPISLIAKTRARKLNIMSNVTLTSPIRGSLSFQG